MMDDDADLELAKRMHILRRRWRWIVEGAVVCGAAAFLVSLVIPKAYRATTYILISESKIGPGSGGAAWFRDSLLPTFIPFVDNAALIDQAIRKFHLDVPPYKLTVEKFSRGHFLDVQIPKSTRLLEIEVTFPNAKLAADLANAFAEGAMSYNDQVNGADTVTTRAFLKKQLDEARERMAAAAARQNTVQKEAAIEDREKELAILLSEKDTITDHLGKLQLAAAQDESKAKSLQKSLAEVPATFLLKKSVSADPDLDRAAETLAPKEKPLSMTEESLNTAREEIQKDLVATLASAAAEHAGIQEATEQLTKVNAQTRQLLSQLAVLRTEIDSTDRDYLLASEGVKRATELYQEASVTVSSKSQDLRQLAPAVVPERPVRPTIVFNTVLGAVVGALLFAGLALVVQIFQDMDQPKPLPVENLERLARRN